MVGTVAPIGARQVSGHASAIARAIDAPAGTVAAHATRVHGIAWAGVALLAAAGGAGGAWALLHEPTAARANAEQGAENIAPLPPINGPAELAPPQPAMRLGTLPGTQLLQLTKTTPAPAVSAADPASFNALLRAEGLGWAASDGTISVPLRDAKRLWLFGDTIVNLPNADGSLRRNADFVRNSAILHDGATATTLLTGTTQDAGDFLRPERPDEWYWPGHGIAEDDEVVLFMGRVRENGGASDWNFEGAGTDLVRLRASNLDVLERRPIPGTAAMNWGQYIVSDAAYTYIYGMQGGEGGGAKVARVPLGHVRDAPFEYWDGAGWSADESGAAIMGDAPSNQFTVVRTPQGKWAMLSQESYFQPGLLVATADTPVGPFTDWRKIDEGPAVGANQIVYNANAQPSFADDGKLLVSWNTQTNVGHLPGPDELEGYRPQFRAIDAASLDD